MIKPSICIITATLNCRHQIENLIESLKNQTDKNFEWVVQDAESKDGTFELVSQLTSLKVSAESVDDFGIYDALNKAIKRCKADYYLVLGADDTLEKDAIENYRQAAKESSADIIAAAIKVGEKILYPMTNMGWFFGMRGVANGHAVGLLIRNDLHSTHGYYSNRFPIMADQYFIKSTLNAGAKIARFNFLAGNYGEDGFSSTNSVFLLFEFFLLQLMTEKYKLLQVGIFSARIIKNIRKIKSIGN